MSVVLHTFDGGTVNAIDDARFYSYLTGGQSGVAEGVRITSAGGLTLHITGGWGVILGRLFTVQAQDIEVTPSVSGTQKGRLILQIDMSDSDRPARIISQAARSLPQLVQEDINGDGLIYQLPLAEYSVTEVALSELKNTTPVLQSTAISTYTQSGNILSGSGANGKFKATAGGTYTAFTIDGQSYAVQSGSESETELTEGVWYTFVLDTEDRTINFSSGGGLSNSKLALATAVPEDVAAGKTFYSGSKELKTGKGMMIDGAVFIPLNASVTISNKQSTIKCAAQGTYAKGVYSYYADITDISSVSVDISAVSGSIGAGFHTVVAVLKDADSAVYSGTAGTQTITGPGRYTIDTSSLTGYYTIVVQPGYAIGASVTVSNVILGG